MSAADEDNTSPESASMMIDDVDAIGTLTARLFSQRRKMIRGIIPGVDWQQFGLTGTERAEEISPETFANMAKFLV